jgi:prepilin-type N-terminal cleavage/methylation domain-containing protein
MHSIISTNGRNAFRSANVTAFQNIRNAFTLVELMVVVAIMAILGALVAGVVVKAIEAQKNSNTMTTMELIKSSLSKQLQAVIDDGKKKEVNSGGAILSTDVVNKVFQQTTKDAVFLRKLVEKGPFSKLETDLLPKGAIGEVGGAPVFLDAWGEQITCTIEYKDKSGNILGQYKDLNATQKAQTKIKFTLESPNVSGGVSN